MNSKITFEQKEYLKKIEEILGEIDQEKAEQLKSLFSSLLLTLKDEIR